MAAMIALMALSVLPTTASASGKASLCTGHLYCPCGSSMLCNHIEGDKCQFLYGFPGMDYLGKSVNTVAYFDRMVGRLTIGGLGDKGRHTLADVIRPTSFFDVDTPDFDHGRFDAAIVGQVCHYVRSNTTNEPSPDSGRGSAATFSTSQQSSAHSSAVNAGFSATTAFVSVSASFAKSSASRQSAGAYSGSAVAYNYDSKLSLAPAAQINPALFAGLPDYDGQVASRKRYTDWFRQNGLYFVSSLSTGGDYDFTTSVTKTAKSDSTSFEAEFKAKVAFVHASGGARKGSMSDEYHLHETSMTTSQGGDDALGAKLLAYQQVIQNETIDLSQFQGDLKAWYASIPANPVPTKITVEHIRDRIGAVHADGRRRLSEAQAAVVDNLLLADDELNNGLRADSLKILRVQYGSAHDFDSHSATALFVDLPPNLASLPYDSSSNAGFSTRYDPGHSCPGADEEAREHGLSRELRYSEHCDASTNLIACDGQPWCGLLTANNIGVGEKELNAQISMRITFVAGAGNEHQQIEFKPCGYGAAWAIYWNEHQLYSHNRTRVAKVVGPRYTNVNGGGVAQLLSDKDKDLFPCTAANRMGGFTDGTDPACCDVLLAQDPAYMASQQVGCPLGCSGHGSCVFPVDGPLHCQCDVGFGGVNCSDLVPWPYFKFEARVLSQDAICHQFYGGSTCGAPVYIGPWHGNNASNDPSILQAACNSREDSYHPKSQWSCDSFTVRADANGTFNPPWISGNTKTFAPSENTSFLHPYHCGNGKTAAHIGDGHWLYKVCDVDPANNIITSVSELSPSDCRTKCDAKESCIGYSVALPNHCYLWSPSPITYGKWIGHTKLRLSAAAPN